MKLQASAKAISVASSSVRCSSVGISLQASVFMVSMYTLYHVTMSHTKGGSSSGFAEGTARHPYVSVVPLEDPQLSTRANDLIINPTDDIEVSPAAYWEIAIKISLGNR
jgi:hypothetical protein